MGNIVNTYLTTIITVFKDVIESYERNEETLRCVEGELNDVLHEIELSPSKDMYRGYLLYLDIKKLREERRRCKDENALLKETYEYFKSDRGQAFKVKMQQLQGGAAKAYTRQENRVYTPRQRNNLTITSEQSAGNKPFEELLKDFKDANVKVEKGKLRK